MDNDSSNFQHNNHIYYNYYSVHKTESVILYIFLQISNASFCFIFFIKDFEFNFEVNLHPNESLLEESTLEKTFNFKKISSLIMASPENLYSPDGKMSGNVAMTVVAFLTLTILKKSFKNKNFLENCNRFFLQHRDIHVSSQGHLLRAFWSQRKRELLVQFQCLSAISWNRTHWRRDFAKLDDK